MIYTILHYSFTGIIIFFIATIAFDLIHYFLHIWTTSKISLLRRFTQMHHYHHLFLTDKMKINNKLIKKNIMFHVIPEYLTQITITSLFIITFSLNSVAIAWFIETIIFIVVIIKKGIDPNHLPTKYLKKFSNQILVSKHYHRYHHIYPNRYFSSYIKIVDWTLGTGMQLKNKKIAITGASGGLGSAMLKQLQKTGVASIATLKYGEDYTENDFSKLHEKLKHQDILILCHGAKQNAMWANNISFQEIIKLYLDVNQQRFTLPEIWGVGSEIECHPAVLPAFYDYKKSKRAYANWTKQFFRGKNVIYRHIVPAAFNSKMGVGLMSANFVARVILFLAKRDCRYIPISYTGIAFLNYFKYKLLPASAKSIKKLKFN